MTNPKRNRKLRTRSTNKSLANAGPVRKLSSLKGRADQSSRRSSTFWGAVKAHRLLSLPKQRVGSSTRCAASLPAWCARSSASRLSLPRPTACASTVSSRRSRRQSQRAMPRLPNPTRHNDGSAVDRPLCDRGRGRPGSVPRHRRTPTAMAHDVRCHPPKGLTKDILGRMIAYRIQEEAFGGLDRETVKLLDRLARGRSRVN